MDENFNPNPNEVSGSGTEPNPNSIPTPGPAIPSAQPTPLSPPAPAAQDEPLGTPTPPPDAPASPSSPTISQPPPSEGTPSANEEQPGAKVGAEDVEEESPIIPTQPKKPKTGLIAGVSAALLLLISIPLGIILIQNQQELREKASQYTCNDRARQYCTADRCGDSGDSLGSGTCPTSAPNCCGPSIPPGSVGTGGSCNTQKDCADNLTCVPPIGGGACKINSGREGCCGNDSQCPSGQTCSTDNGACESGKSCRQTSTPRGSVNTGGSCTAQEQCANNLTCKDGICKINSGREGCCGNDSQCPSGQTCSTDNGACESGKSCKAGAGPGGVTNPNQCTAKAEDGQTLATQPSSVQEDFLSRFPQNFCQKWADEHNTAIKSILVYSHPDGKEIKSPGKDTVKAGDAVKFCVKRANSTRYSQLKIVVNGNVSKYANATTLTSDNIGDLFCIKYDIPASATSLRLTGEWQP